MSAVTWSRLCSHSHLFFELAARQQMQSRSCAALWTLPRSINASLLFERQLNRTRDEPGVSRKVWSAIVFGFELEMLHRGWSTCTRAPPARRGRIARARRARAGRGPCRA